VHAVPVPAGGGAVVTRAKLALGVLLVLSLLCLTHPAGMRTAVTGLMWGLGSLLAVTVAGWAGTYAVVRRGRRAAVAARRRTLRDLPPAAGEPATAFDRLAAGSYEMPAPPAAVRCSGGCSRPAAVTVRWLDGRPDARYCAACHADLAASEAARIASFPPALRGGCCPHGVPPEPDGPRRCGICDLPALGPDNAPGRLDMSEFES
jgi:hypothetical protein